MGVRCNAERGRVTFAFDGDIDEYACRTLRESIDSVIAEKRPAEVVFDLGGVAFVDSTGLGLILGRYKKIAATGGVLRLKDVPTQVDKVFRASGVYSVPLAAGRHTALLTCSNGIAHITGGKKL